jgi:vacuolar-type H+-ATPase subunit E/Vma4
MAKTLGEITDQLTKQIVAPAKAEAESILQRARQEAEETLKAGKEEAERIIEKARRDTENLQKQMTIDLETAARNFLIMVEERLERAIVDPVIEEALRPLLSDKEFLGNMIVSLINAFNQQGGKEHRIDFLLPEAQKKQLEAWFTERFRDKALHPVTVKFTDKISFGFKLGIGGKGSSINFSDGLLEVFSEFCSPRFRKYFYPRKES